MKIWANGHWHEQPHAIIVIYLTEQDKKNIAAMYPDCDLYCDYDDEYKTEYIVELLTKLKKEAKDDLPKM